MKKILKNAAVFLYFVATISILGTALFYPFLLGSDDAPPMWVTILLGVLVVLIVATLEKAQQWIFNQNK